MSFFVIIPARYGSSRFPGKPLIDLAGKTMIRRVCEQAMMSDAKEVFVATDDERIAREVKSLACTAIMTAMEHASGSDRVCEAAELIGLDAQDVIVNVQGDEPLVPPDAINLVAGAVTGNIEMATLREAITDPADVFNPNLVKVVVDAQDVARYFSRAPIPWARDLFERGAPASLPAHGRWYRHLGIYAYSLSMLRRFVSWSPSLEEQTERLEQLRALSHGERIRVLESLGEMPPGIDAPDDVGRVLAAINKLEQE